MTTKKQRRLQVAEKNAAFREAERLENLEKLERSKDRAEQKRFEKERAENKKKAAQKIKAMTEPTPENLENSFQAALSPANEATRMDLEEVIRIAEEDRALAEEMGIDVSRRSPAEQLLHDIFRAREETS